MRNSGRDYETVGKMTRIPEKYRRPLTELSKWASCIGVELLSEQECRFLQQWEGGEILSHFTQLSLIRYDIQTYRLRYSFNPSLKTGTRELDRSLAILLSFTAVQYASENADSQTRTLWGSAKKSWIQQLLGVIVIIYYTSGTHSQVCRPIENTPQV